jgi:guanylate kinase
MTPGEFRELPQDLRKGCCVVYLDIDRETRESRLHNRDDKNDSVQRRLNSDDNDFSEYFDYDLKITDADFGADDIYSLIE